MAHEVSVSLVTKVVASKDFEVMIKTITGGKTQTLGKNLISKGNIEWLAGGHKVNKKQVTWLQFAELMKNGKTVRTKPKKQNVVAEAE